MVLYYTTKYDFPVTNHTANVDNGNIGWIRGVMADDLPFEAEIWKKDNETDVGFLIPAIFSEDDDTNPYDTSDKIRVQENKRKQGIAYIHYEMEMWDGGILHIGMVDEGYEEDPFVVQNYVEILENNELIEYTSDLCNGYVQYVTDSSGNEFARIVVTLEDKDGEHAVCPLFFEKFPQNKTNTGFRVIK